MCVYVCVGVGGYMHNSLPPPCTDRHAHTHTHTDTRLHVRGSSIFTPQLKNMQPCLLIQHGKEVIQVSKFMI